jgi:hypothetical protein
LIFGCNSNRIHGIAASEDQPCIGHIGCCQVFVYQRRICEFDANAWEIKDIPPAVNTQLGKRRLLV